MLSFRRKIRIFWLILLFLIVIFFAFRFVSPSGSWRCRQDFAGSNILPDFLSLSAPACISSASPAERVVRTADGPLLVLADPIYVSIFSPRPFSHAEVEIVYRPLLSSSPPVFEAGFLADALRGAHQFYFYLPQAGLELNGSFFDLNNNKDNDEAQFLIFSGQRQVVSVNLADQRPQAEESADRSPVQAFSISRSDLAPGLYRLEFKANDDLVLNSLRVNSSYLSAINKIWPFDQEKISLLTDAPYLQVKSLDPGALQDFSFGQERLSLSEIYHQYEFKSRQGGVQAINLELVVLIF